MSSRDSDITVHAWQFAPQLGNLAANKDAIIEGIEKRLAHQRRATEANLDTNLEAKPSPNKNAPDKTTIVVLPELCLSGYNFADKDQAAKLAMSRNDAFFDSLQDLCRKKGVHLVLGYCEKSSSNLFNASILLSPSEHRGHYRKRFLFFKEKQIFTPGDLGIPVFKVGDLRLAMLICYDWAFAENWLSLFHEKVDLVCLPANLVQKEKAQRAIPAMALMHKYYIVLANRIGTESDLTFTGGSMIVEPILGHKLAHAGPESTEWISAEIYPGVAQDKNINPYNNLVTDREIL